jgi:broad specificity phosphatase PhoE
VTTLLLARHGETDWNRDGRFQGHADPPLNDRGRRQAHALADFLAAEPLEAIYSSDLLRAEETAQIVAMQRGMDVLVDPQLRERDVGEWSGLTFTQIEERFPNQIQAWREGRVVVGESREALTERVVAAARRISAAHPEGVVLVVSHGGALRMLRHASGADLSGPGLANTEVVRVAVRDGGLLRLTD